MIFVRLYVKYPEMPPKMPRSLVSLSQIAKIAGVSRMTVSYALRNKPEVSGETQQRIMEIAKSLGYVPDARMSAAMMAVRNAKHREPIPIAWINTDVNRDMWKYPYMRPYKEGAEGRCASLGYRLEEFWVKEPGMTMRRMSQILYQRGIQGIIVAPPDSIHLGHIRLNWANFASASFDKAIIAPRLYSISSDCYYNLALSLKVLRRHGYTRIGVCLPQLVLRRSSHLSLAAIEQFQSKIPESERIPPIIHLYKSDAGDEFMKWFARYRPDVVVGQHSRLIEWIVSTGAKVPTDVGVVHMALEDDCADWAGIWCNRREIGATTAETVISQLEHNQFGLPSIPREILIRGSWRYGKTLLCPKP